MRAVPREGPQRGRDDHGKRGADREVHPDRLVDAERAEQLVQHRHQDAAATDPEQAGEQPGEEACHEQGCEQQRDLAGRNAEIHPGRSEHDVAARRQSLSAAGDEGDRALQPAVRHHPSPILALFKPAACRTRLSAVRRVRPMILSYGRSIDEEIVMRLGTAKLSSKFQISIPKAVRTARHWQAGQEFAFLPKGEGVLLVPVPKREDLAGLARGASPRDYRDRTDRA
jgi:AbrB family looped-hinge helix DNA binding protein